MTFKFKSLAGALLLAVFSAQASAATATLDGDHFTISYDTDAIGLFGAPSLIGNSLVFAPSGSPGFSAQTGSGIKFTNSTFSFVVTADAGYKLSGFDLYEAGDYFLIGEGSKVSVGGQLRVKSVGQPLLSAAVAPSQPLTTHTSFESMATSNWEAIAAINPTQAMSNAVVSIQNLLGAYVPTNEMGYAFIEKKNVELGFSVTPIPEPESYAMLLAGLGLMGVVARRRGKLA